MVLKIWQLVTVCQGAACWTKAGLQAVRCQHHGPSWRGASCLLLLQQHQAPCKDCKFRTAKCRHCRKVGHIQKACRSKGKAQTRSTKGSDEIPAAACSSGDWSQLWWRHLSVVTTPDCTCLCECKLEQVDVPMKLDTEASFTVISEATLANCRGQHQHSTTASAHRSEAMDLQRGRDSCGW